MEKSDVKVGLVPELCKAVTFECMFYVKLCMCCAKHVTVVGSPPDNVVEEQSNSAK